MMFLNRMYGRDSSISCFLCDSASFLFVSGGQYSHILVSQGRIAFLFHACFLKAQQKMYAYLELNLFSALTSLENTGLIEIQSVILKVISLLKKKCCLFFVVFIIFHWPWHEFPEFKFASQTNPLRSDLFLPRAQLARYFNNAFCFLFSRRTVLTCFMFI